MAGALRDRMLMEFVFWLSIFLIVYPYAVYPLLLAVWGSVRPRRPCGAPRSNRR
jgi:hypothetical protein